LSSASGLELAFDERDKAEAMSAHFNTEHYEIVLKAGDMERSLPSLAWHLEEPRVGQSYPNYYAAKLASKFVKVVLSGAGGDELFAGYPWRYYQTAQSQNFDQYIDNYYLYWQRLVSNTDLKQLFSPIWKEVNDVWTRDIFEGVFKNHPNELKTQADFVNHSLYFEAKTFLHGLLVVEDKLSMAFGLETRLPFLDNDLVDFAQQVPVALKIAGHDESERVNENDIAKKNKILSHSSNGKQILREAMSQIIPSDVTRSKKQGFSAPDASWFQGQSMDFVNRELLQKNKALHKIFDFKTLKDLINTHLSGEKNQRLFIWSMLYFKFWKTNNFDKEI
jgi:asparagine synthase (glutamine-hydrolysing)